MIQLRQRKTELGVQPAAMLDEAMRVEAATSDPQGESASSAPGCVAERSTNLGVGAALKQLAKRRLSALSLWKPSLRQSDRGGSLAHVEKRCFQTRLNIAEARAQSIENTLSQLRFGQGSDALH